MTTNSGTTRCGHDNNELRSELIKEKHSKDDPLSKGMSFVIPHHFIWSHATLTLSLFSPKDDGFSKAQQPRDSPYSLFPHLQAKWLLIHCIAGLHAMAYQPAGYIIRQTALVPLGIERGGELGYRLLAPQPSIVIIVLLLAYRFQALIIAISMSIFSVYNNCFLPSFLFFYF